MKVGIRGMGLIGGSFEKAFLRKGHSVANLKEATGETIRECELIVVCLPPLQVAPWITEHAGDFAPNAIITDAAGVKGIVTDALANAAKSAKWTYIGGHPMAGKEHAGYENAEATLFDGASMILTPYEWTPQPTIERLRQIMLEIGFGRVVTTTPTHHDEMIAYTSQLAHIVSSAYVRDRLSAQHTGYSAGSYLDMTRVATVNPEMWTDLFLANREGLLPVLERLIGRLTEYRNAIRDDNDADLKRLLSEGRAMKETAG